MSAGPNPSLRQAAIRTGAAAFAVLVLTSAHHAYGAFAFATPWRLHILALVLPTAAAIGFVLHRAATTNDQHAARRAARLAAFLISLIPIAAIGIYEGGYNHVFKNIVFFGLGDACGLTLFPPPLYERPSDLFFEFSGIAQFPLSLVAALHALRLFRGVKARGRSYDDASCARPACSALQH